MGRGSGRMVFPAMAVHVLSFLLCGASLTAAEGEWHRGMFRVNTTISAGDDSVEVVAEKASKAGLEFIVFSDQYLVRAKYGLPPFRNLVSFTKERDSIVSYGVENYLAAIEAAQRRHPEIVMLPGADIAPHYYWTGNYLFGTLATHQFSEQLTVFGDLGVDFYRDLPVIHNERKVFNLWSVLKLSPLLIALVGLVLLFRQSEPYYADRQGHTYVGKGDMRRRIIGGLLAILGIAWAADNRPFTKDLGAASPHSARDLKPFQRAIDYVRERGGGKAGVIWSAPEALMKDKIGRVWLLTVPYLPDLEVTQGHNGLAGIYADASHAHEPGSTWDKMLLEYCVGTRPVRPVIVGESDYHGRTPVDFIQTVVRSPGRLDRAALTQALTEGSSYAVATQERRRLFVKEAQLADGNGQTTGMGGTLKVAAAATPVFTLRGGIEGGQQGKPVPGSLVIVMDGKELRRVSVDAVDFEIKEELSLDKGRGGLHYVRFYVRADRAGWLLSNPLFMTAAGKGMASNPAIQ